ncbi:plasmid mobilization relaxosome protein MobC [Roseivirga sp. BDSF3-8]|uniref:plasmid mobilization protein n=1 Tax=Roseivirga sp. BDSF3-8 TaxID=3241598 RepID=UPI003531A005
MKREKKNPLQARVHVRMSQSEKEKLKQMLSKSHCHRSISELVRHLLFHSHITLDYRNASQDEARAELIRLRNDLRKIGVNINQMVRYFHRQDGPAFRQAQAEKIIRLYEQAHTQVITVLKGISHLLKG